MSLKACGTVGPDPPVPVTASAGASGSKEPELGVDLVAHKPLLGVLG